MSEFQNCKELHPCPAGYDCQGMMQTKAAIAAKDCQNLKTCSKLACVITDATLENTESFGFADVFERIFSSW